MNFGIVLTFCFILDLGIILKCKWTIHLMESGLFICIILNVNTADMLWTLNFYDNEKIKKNFKCSI